MGFLDFFGGGRERSRARLEPDAVWLTARAKLAGLRRRVEELSSTRCVLVLAQFRSTLEAIQQSSAPSSGWRRLDQQADVSSVLVQRAPGAALASAWSLPPEGLGATAGDGELEVLVAERHPLRSHDDRVAAAIGRLAGRPRLTFHLSLEDGPFLVVRQRIGPLLERLGMDENEVLQQPMISKAIARAQAQMATKATGDLPADTAEEWLRLNMAGSLRT
jgi:hypothetical protein